jgi:hypothetical protein
MDSRRNSKRRSANSCSKKQRQRMPPEHTARRVRQPLRRRLSLASNLFPHCSTSLPESPSQPPRARDVAAAKGAQTASGAGRQEGRKGQQKGRGGCRHGGTVLRLFPSLPRAPASLRPLGPSAAALQRPLLCRSPLVGRAGLPRHKTRTSHTQTRSRRTYWFHYSSSVYFRSSHVSHAAEQ